MDFSEGTSLYTEVFNGLAKDVQLSVIQVLNVTQKYGLVQ